MKRVPEVVERVDFPTLVSDLATERHGLFQVCAGPLQIALIHGHDTQVDEGVCFFQAVSALACRLEKLLGQGHRAAQFFGPGDSRWCLRRLILRGRGRRTRDQEELVTDGLEPRQSRPVRPG